MPYVWNVALVRYRDTVTGRFVKPEVVLGWLKESVEGSKAALQRQAIADNFTAFKQELKEEYIRQYIAGRGGLPQMEQSDWGRLGQLIREQYRFADKFATDLSSLTEAQATVRAGLYAESAHNGFHVGMRQAVIKSGQFTEEFWELGSTEHCDGCETLNSKGWVPVGELGTTPRAGDTECLVHCGCNIKYR